MTAGSQKRNGALEKQMIQVEFEFCRDVVSSKMGKQLFRCIVRLQHAVRRVANNAIEAAALHDLRKLRWPVERSLPGNGSVGNERVAALEVVGQRGQQIQRSLAICADAERFADEIALGGHEPNPQVQLGHFDSLFVEVDTENIFARDADAEVIHGFGNFLRRIEQHARALPALVFLLGALRVVRGVGFHERVERA